MLSVGFADLVSYTRLAQRLEERELAALVDRFGKYSADVIAAAGGRLVKTVGDEVLFVADRAEDAALIGLELADSSSRRRWPRTRCCPTYAWASPPAPSSPAWATSSAASSTSRAG